MEQIKTWKIKTRKLRDCITKGQKEEHMILPMKSNHINQRKGDQYRRMIFDMLAEQNYNTMNDEKQKKLKMKDCIYKAEWNSDISSKEKQKKHSN